VRLAPFALALFLVALSGCGGHDWAGLWREEFETTCDGSPCGWTQVAGPAGAATWIETGPSEHGVRLDGTAAIATTAPGDEVIGSDSLRTMRGHMVARCDAGAQLTLIVSVQDLAGGTPIDTAGSATFPSEWDGTRTTFDLFIDDPVNTNAQYTDILNVVIHKEGRGACEIDYVSLADDSHPFPE
jgi:hypothetical protein